MLPISKRTIVLTNNNSTKRGKNIVLKKTKFSFVQRLKMHIFSHWTGRKSVGQFDTPSNPISNRVELRKFKCVHEVLMGI